MEKVGKVHFTRMRNGTTTAALTNVDIQEIIELGGKVIEI